MAAETRGWRVAGRVQGVFFRASTRNKALKLGLSGYALNEPDGTVSVAARGESGALDDLARWLEHGPPAARVDQLSAVSPDLHRLPDSGFDTG